MGRVQDKVAIITGAASGVGKEDALLLAREGARVVLTDLNEEAGRAVAKQIGDAALFVKHDIASDEDLIHAGQADLVKDHLQGGEVAVDVIECCHSHS